MFFIFNFPLLAIYEFKLKCSTSYTKNIEPWLCRGIFSVQGFLLSNLLTHARRNSLKLSGGKTERLGIVLKWVVWSLLKFGLIGNKLAIV